MTEYQPQDLSEVESLLVTRQKLTEWLEKLDVAGNKTPAAVRSKVQSDYQGRLSNVVERLREHCDVLSSTAKELRLHAEERDRTRAELQDTLSEAELRHAVGEFTDQEWQ